jgi:hypothetical protein
LLPNASSKTASKPFVELDASSTSFGGRKTKTEQSQANREKSCGKANTTVEKAVIKA